MKRGFTIVELAIVLVVIGIILAMAVKGKALVDAARMKAEVAKLNKFEAAAYTYYAITGNFPDGYFIGADNFTARELLTKADFEQKITGAWWGFYTCGVYSDNPGNPGYKKVLYNGARSNICVATTAGIDVNGGSSGFRTVPLRLSCNIEVMKDDENSTTGSGRGWGSLSAMTEDYRDCNKYSLTEEGPYAFIVF